MKYDFTNDQKVKESGFQAEPTKSFSFNPTKVYIVIWSENYLDWGIEKVFYSYDKAANYIKYRDKMTGCDYSIYEKDIEDYNEF